MSIFGSLFGKKEAETTTITHDEERYTRVETRRVEAIIMLRSHLPTLVGTSRAAAEWKDAYEKTAKDVHIIVGFSDYIPKQHKSGYAGYVAQIRKGVERLADREVDLQDNVKFIDYYAKKLLELEKELTRLESGFIESAKRRLEHLHEAELAYKNLLGEVSIWRDPRQAIPAEKLAPHRESIRRALERAKGAVQVRQEMSRRVDAVYQNLEDMLPPPRPATINDVQDAYDRFSTFLQDAIHFEEDLIRIESERIIDEKRLEDAA